MQTPTDRYFIFKCMQIDVLKMFEREDTPSRLICCGLKNLLTLCQSDDTIS